jgi:formate dehydrogenase subunit delta
MTPEKMVHMANQIALFFAGYPQDEAVAGVADHIQKFWEPRMRAQLTAYLAAGGANLHPLVIAATRTLAPARTGRTA